jgi:hypothetical protein
MSGFEPGFRNSVGIGGGFIANVDCFPPLPPRVDSDDCPRVDWMDEPSSSYVDPTDCPPVDWGA